ncbi:hypothetical protein HDU96_005973 [Phlyctochytrium bullatum]|nr:hypothetical protein HDU96_005973 [Phlyctochytrium bullatum]
MEKKKSRKGVAVDADGFANHPVVRQLIANKKGIKAPGGPGLNSATAELKLEELDEDLLRQRSEIEATKKDTAEYIEYLYGKKGEKEAAINKLIELQKQDQELFLNRRKAREAENKAKIEELKAMAVELEMKLEAKQQEIMQLTDVMTKRARHESELAKIRKEIADADALHAQAIADLERSLLEVRIKLQREADAKITEMENAAQEKAAKYLSDHTTALEAENRKLEIQLRKCILATQEYIARKDLLETENKELLRRLKVRDNLLKLRTQAIVKSQDSLLQLKKERKLKAMSLKSRLIEKTISGIEEEERRGNTVELNPNSAALSMDGHRGPSASRESGPERGASRMMSLNGRAESPAKLKIVAGTKPQPDRVTGQPREKACADPVLDFLSDSESDDEYLG